MFLNDLRPREKSPARATSPLKPTPPSPISNQPIRHSSRLASSSKGAPLVYRVVDLDLDKEGEMQSAAPSQDGSVHLLMTKVDQLQQDNVDFLAAVKSLQELVVQMQQDQAEFFNDMMERLADMVLEEVANAEEAAPGSPPT